MVPIKNFPTENRILENYNSTKPALDEKCHRETKLPSDCNYSDTSFADFFAALVVGYLYFIGYAAILIAISWYPNVKQIQRELSDAEGELDLIRIGNSTLEQRAQKLFRLHQIELKRYYDQTLMQSTWIFYAGITCLLVGIIIDTALYGLFHIQDMRPLFMKRFLSLASDQLAQF